MRTRSIATTGLSVLLGFIGLSAQTISISGTLIDAQTLAAVQGATVNLVGKSMTTTTNAQGVFGFQNSTTVFNEKAPRSVRTDNISIRDGFLRIVNGSGFLKNAVVELFDARGRCLFRETIKNPDGGSQNYALRSLAGSRAFFLRVNANGASAVRKLITTGGKNSLSINFADQGGALKKSLAAVIDSIVITKTGYQAKTVTLTAYLVSLGNVPLFKTGACVWSEQILNGDGTINWTQYENVAAHAGELAQRDYLLGPKYCYYHPQTEAFPTLALQGDASGWEGPAEMKMPDSLSSNRTDHYFEHAGPLVYVPDDANNAGVIEAANGEHFWFDEYPSLQPQYAYWDRLHWDPRRKGWYTNTDPQELHQPDWNSPKKPTALAFPTGVHGSIVAYIAFQNGLIGTFPNVQAYSVASVLDSLGGRYPFVQLPAGKTPMALTVTPGGEFVLAAVWDAINHKGQLAVIAVQGQVLCSQPSRTWDDFYNGVWMYGFPYSITTKGMKLLGFVDLPIVAPTAIEAGHNLAFIGSGRADTNINAHINALLDNQSERDKWYTGSAAAWPNYKRTASAGYVIVASRSENKVVFVDLQPLLTYYRTMYFTTQARYNETKNVGPAANQWPYPFDHSPEQTPVVACTLAVAAPTAVAAGLSAGFCGGPGYKDCNVICGWDAWRYKFTGGNYNVVSSFGDGYAYITTMDGRLLIYTVGGLITAAAATQPVLYKTINIGKNPTSISHGEGGMFLDDFFINCRGDKSIYALSTNAGGDVMYVLRDSRIQDPVMAENSFLIYEWDMTYYRYYIHVVDFTGKNVLTYVYKQDFPEPPKFGAASDPLPGHPFAYQQGEVP
ncbi:MAG: hypothetical protein PHC61_10925 [Chitinivibrionales bacterium]|nr:hypothetical protein [Chitinivibrionales bacterium]